jgi:2-amino-4-hydroxy-6-hydroxymethyldihydropteridine diphosphokinase
MAEAAVGLGSNVGDRLENLRSAIRSLSARYAIRRISSLFLTAPVGGPAQDEYLNAVVVIESSEPPEEILGHLQEIENAAGRVREERWGPRTLDLDLLTVRGVASDREELSLPHPRAHLRRFVVAPLTEIWPDAQLRGGRAADHLGNLVDQRADRVAEVWHEDRIEFLHRGGSWVVGQTALVALCGLVMIFDGTWPRGWRWVALVGIAFAAWLMLRAAAELGRALTPYPTPRRAELATAGVYRWVRHPMYLGVVLVLASAATLVGSLWALLVAATTAVFLWVKAGFEEKWLRIVYPEYDEYRQQVRARLLPFLPL